MSYTHGLGDVRPIDYTVKPGEDVLSYMRRIAGLQQTEIKIALHMKEFDARLAADAAAAKAAAAAAAAGFAVPPGAQAAVARDQAAAAGMPMTTKLIVGGVAALALFMLLTRRK